MGCIYQRCIFYHSKNETARRENQSFGIYVCGIPVRFKNAADVLGDCTVVYDNGSNMLILSNATLEYNGSAIIFSEKDLTIALNGENKLICNGAENTAGIYASDYMLRKDISFIGSGSLTIENGEGASGIVGAIVADDICAYSDITIALTQVAEDSAGIECGNLCLMGENTVSVKVDSTGESYGVFASGNVSLLDNTTLDVTNTNAGRNHRGIECTGNFMACKGSTIKSAAAEGGAGILCHSVFFDYGATVNTKIDAVDGIRHE